LSSTSTTTIIQIKTFRPEGTTILNCLAEKEGTAQKKEKLRELQTSSTVISFW